MRENIRVFKNNSALAQLVMTMTTVSLVLHCLRADANHFFQRLIRLWVECERRKLAASSVFVDDIILNCHNKVDEAMLFVRDIFWPI